MNELTAFLSLHKKISLTILTMIYEEDSGVGRLSTPPFTRISKLQLFTNQLLMKRLETTRKYLQWKMQRKNHKSRRGRFTVQPIPTRPHWWPTNRRKIVEVLLKEWGIWAPHWAPKSRGLMVRKQTLRMFVFEGQWGLLSGDPEGYGNRDSTLKEHTQNLTHFMTHGRGSNLKGFWGKPTC